MKVILLLSALVPIIFGKSFTLYSAPECTEEQVDQLWPDPDSKEHYYQCLDIGEPYRLQCGSKKWFDFNKQVCVNPDEWTPPITTESPTDTTPTNPTNPTEPTKPTIETTKPTVEPTEPTNEPTEPTDEPTEPTDEPTEPTDEPTEPTDEPTEPTEPTNEPTEPTTEGTPTPPTAPTRTTSNTTVTTTTSTESPSRPTPPTPIPTAPTESLLVIENDINQKFRKLLRNALSNID